MSDAISSVLSQIRSLQGQIGVASGGVPQAAPSAVTPAVKAPEFSETLQNSLAKVNASQLDAGAIKTAYEYGEPGVDLVRVMIASQQAQIGFRATVEVRNRLVQAYQDIMNMPV